MDTKQVITRFEAERQALAMMDHPFVAKVFDAGSTSAGRPYFVMEYVAGVPITEHCDRNRLTTRERLDLFMQVCQGVQHAHQKAILHRDLKPSNVLVSVQDGKAIPKIIDFGVAKATAQRLTEQTMFTALGVLIGTPEYMSPEQAELTGQDVDTRTDVYSLGVMLYELLVGTLPFDPQELRSAGLDGIRRKILNQEPSKPSTRLATLGGERSTESARCRRVDVPSLRRQLKGDLDWITMKALEKDRARRYGSPAELAADIERHLTDQAVLAGPPSRTYRTWKFTRRHRVGVAVAAAGLVVLISFAATMTVQAGRIARERDRANHEAQTAVRVSDFLTGLFSASDPRMAKGKEPTAREILSRGVERIDRELDNEPLVKARLLRTLGAVHERLAIYDKAENLLNESLQQMEKLLGKDDVETLRSASALAWLYRNQSRLPEAEKLLRRVVEGRRKRLGNKDPETLKAMSDLAVVLEDQGRYDEAETIARQVLEARRTVLGPEHPDTLMSFNNLGSLESSLGRYPEAEALLRQANGAQQRILGRDHPDTLLSLANLAVAVARQGHMKEGEALIRQSYEADRRVFGDDHPETLSELAGLAGALFNLHRNAEAEHLWRQTYDGARRISPADDEGNAYIMACLGMTLAKEGRPAEGEPLIRQALANAGRIGSSVVPRSFLPYAVSRAGRFAEADALYREALEATRKSAGENRYRSARLLYCRACSEALRGRRDEAIGYLEQAADAGLVDDAILDDKDLDSIQSDPRFSAIAGRIERGTSAGSSGK
jgi:eukaryotic-like serine/threonine-protein kinase